MRTAARSAGYGALLVAAFTAAWTAGVIARPAPVPLTPVAATPPAAAPVAASPPDIAPPEVAQAATRVAEVDGYQVRLDGDLAVGPPAQVFVTVSRDGAGVTDLEPLDGAFGRIVGLRAGGVASG